MSRARALRGLWAAPAAVLALPAGSPAAAGVGYGGPVGRRAAAADLYVAPDASPGGKGTAEQPFASVDQAQQPAHRLSADSNVVVHLAGGTYRPSKPPTSGSGDGGQNGHSITYQAAPGRQPVVSGAQQVVGWQVHDRSRDIWSVHVGTGVNTGIRFTETSWLGPSGPDGYADQQSGAHITGINAMPANWLSTCKSGCTRFEATRNHWAQAGSGIQVGGIQPDAHHPGNPQMTNQNITISNNKVSGVGDDYKETPAILSTCVTNATITHNQCDHLAYDGIDIGWGWGVNAPGGSREYVNRGTYTYQPVYSTPTTLKNNTVAHNLIYDTKNAMFDDGSIYNLSASPGSVISDNYMYDNNHADDSTFLGNWYATRPHATTCSPATSGSAVPTGRRAPGR
ncbi:right-handed parallel beta-helix repeat-containing protein [Streptomyces sp. NPDC088560]|uniref:right-handed parallel beta-helix repeat-containing protein n=1 Tax=Streptomyces sp. NPDC088560 TaxID=3365868 RepID=UPI00382B3E32